MIVLDTNVVSAVMKPRPIPAIVDWLDEQPTERLFLTSITIAEIGFGLHVLPAGKKRSALEERFEVFLERGFAERVLVFDLEAARHYAELMARRRRRGRPMSALDGQIAAIARANRCAVATGNVRDFEGCGLEILDPFPYS